MNTPDTKYLLLVASPSDMDHPSASDLKAVQGLRDKIASEILQSISVRIAPKMGGPLRAAEALLGKDWDPAHTRHPNGERFDATYITKTLRRRNESDRGILAVVPLAQLNGIAAALTSGDKRPEIAGIQSRTAQPIVPGAGILVAYKGPWSAFDPKRAEIVQFSCPSTPECLKANPLLGTATSRRNLVAALGGVALFASRPKRQP